MERYRVAETGLGPMTVVWDGEFVTGLLYGAWPRGEAGEAPLAQEVLRQLEEYLDGARREFSLPLRPAGTPFQRAVWQALGTIPYGQTRTYGEVAAQVGRPKACRAVGMANNRNPLSILVPCHRVVGKNGALTGYAGGLDVKARLLKLEQTIK